MTTDPNQIIVLSYAEPGYKQWLLERFGIRSGEGAPYIAGEPHHPHIELPTSNKAAMLHISFLLGADDIRALMDLIPEGTTRTPDAPQRFLKDPDPQCSGPGYAHPPHGNCKGYTTDRT